MGGEGQGRQRKAGSTKEQLRPESQTLPAQHGWSLPPQGAHVPLADWHWYPAAHQPPLSVGQQSCPLPPQGAQTLSLHEV